MPDLRGPNGGGQRFFGWTFDGFYTWMRSYELDAPDLAQPISHGLGFDAQDAYRAFVLAAALPGYFWVAVQRASTYQMTAFPAACFAADVLPVVARWIPPGVQLRWTSGPGARSVGLPHGWHISDQYLRDMGNRLFFAYAPTTGEVFIVTSASVAVRAGNKHARVLATCRRAKQLARVRAEAPLLPGGRSHRLTPKLLRRAYRWGAQHLRNVVLKQAR